jgi:hypothetical protein
MTFNCDASIYNKYRKMNNIELGEYIKLDNKSGFKTREKHIKDNFPETYEAINNIGHKTWFTNLYDFINGKRDMVCPECGESLEIKIFNLGYQKYCSPKCKNKNPDFKEKVKKIMLIKYGVDNASKSQIVKEKIKNKLCHNNIWSVQTNEFKKKSKETCNNKYGVSSYSKLEIFHEKMKKTSTERYGVDSYNKTEASKKYAKENSIKKYGAEYYLSTDEFKEKSRQTNLKKRGVTSHTKTNDYKLKMKKYYLNKYGVEYYLQTDEGKKKIHNTMIEKYGEIWLKHIPKYNPNSILYIDAISEKLGMFIQHALNGGEKKFTKYWVDGYIEKYNICIEWDEKHHNTKRQMEHDIKRDEFLKNEHNCMVIRINESEFLKDILASTDKYTSQINDYIAIIGN